MQYQQQHHQQFQNQFSPSNTTNTPYKRNRLSIIQDIDIESFGNTTTNSNSKSQEQQQQQQQQQDNETMSTKTTTKPKLLHP